jgi:formamidopyrimidine-DNA glycosylase
VPELPEVETIAGDLRAHLVGRTIATCEVRMPSIVRHPDSALFAAALPGRRIEALARRGKYLFHDLDDGELLVVHLGMTGQWRLVDAVTPEPDHLHAVIGLDDGRQLRYRDPRRFGRLLLGTETELLAARKLPRLGAEPLDPAFSAADLHRRLAGRRAPLKAVLLDQKVVAGVGNIYADEACFRARVRPDRPAWRLSRRSAGRLHVALRDLLREAIANRGSSVSDYRDAWGQLGGEQHMLQVYGRGGQPCTRCGRPLASLRLAGRTTVFCRRCQR